jgi:hypothetical protein
MKPDGDLAGIPVVAYSLDDGLYGLDLMQAIELFPLGVLKDAVLRKKSV